MLICKRFLLGIFNSDVFYSRYLFTSPGKFDKMGIRRVNGRRCFSNHWHTRIHQRCWYKSIFVEMIQGRCVFRHALVNLFYHLFGKVDSIFWWITVIWVFLHYAKKTRSSINWVTDVLFSPESFGFQGFSSSDNIRLDLHGLCAKLDKNKQKEGYVVCWDPELQVFEKLQN